MIYRTAAADTRGARVVIPVDELRRRREKKQMERFDRRDYE